MIDFIELNETQKNYVVYLLTILKHTKDEITLAEMKGYHSLMQANRANGGPKFGYPNWIIVPENKVSKSVYQFPCPTQMELDAFYAGDVAPQINLSKYSPMFQKVVQDYGIL